MHTDQVFNTIKNIEQFTTEEISQAVDRYWPKAFYKILVISIDDKRYNKLRNDSQILSKYFEKVIGVDGRTLPTLDVLQDQGIYLPLDKYNTLTRGQIGCFLSHRKVWQKMVAENIESCLILEDDCKLEPNPHTLQYIHNVFEKQLNFEWNMIYLGRNPTLCINTRKVRENLVTVGKTWGLFAYGLTLSGAKQLLSFTNKPITYPVDTFISDHKVPTRTVALSPIAFLIREGEESLTQKIK